MREPNVASEAPTSDARQNEEQFGALPEPSATDNEASIEELEAALGDAEVEADADSAESQSPGSSDRRVESGSPQPGGPPSDSQTAPPPSAPANRPQTGIPPAGSNAPSSTPVPETSSAEASGETGSATESVTGPATDSDSPTDSSPDAATDAPVQRSTAESSTPSAPPAPASPSPAPAAEAEVFEPPEANRQGSRPPVSGGASRGDVFSPPAVEGIIRPEQSAGQTDGATPDDEALSNNVIVPVPAAPGQPPRSLSNQVSTYFQRRWHAGEIGPITTAPLTYRLELSQTGSVVSFTALDQVSEGYRDRILPTNNPPSFRRPVSPQGSPTETGTLDAASDVSLRVVFRADGTVEVLPF